MEKDSVESNMKPRFLADRLGVMSLVVGRERGVDYFRGLLRHTDEKEFSFRGICWYWFFALQRQNDGDD